jgi:cytochrome b involved in lipid metabolism
LSRNAKIKSEDLIQQILTIRKTVLQGVAGKDATKKFNKYHRPALISRYEARLKIGQVQPEQSVEKKSKFRIRLNFGSYGDR